MSGLARAILRLSPSLAQRTSIAMPAELFDMRLRAMRRDRAARLGPETFLLQRAFDDCLERLQLFRRRFNRALLLGCPDPAWPERLGAHAGYVRAADPGPIFAALAGGEPVIEDRMDFGTGDYDLCVAVGTLDTVNDLPIALRLINRALLPDSLLIGAILGGDSLPRLRTAMRAADAIMGAASPHIHPRIDAAALAPLLADAGYVMPVVDVDRVQVEYESLQHLVDDLRRMGATNILAERSRRPLSQSAMKAAQSSFKAPGESRSAERFELLHFAAWTPADARMRGR